MPTYTTNYNLAKPLVADAIDEDLWGGYLNDNFDILDTTVKSVSDTTLTDTVAVTSAYSVLLTDRNKLIKADATSASFSIALPSAATALDGFEVTIKKTDASANTVTVDPNASETIDGQSTLSLTEQYDVQTYVCDGTNWLIKSFYEVPEPITVSQKSTNTAQGTWNITGLVAYKPVIITYDTGSGDGGVQFQLTGVVGCQTGARWGIDDAAVGSYGNGSPPTMVLIPTGTSISLTNITFVNPGITNTLEAWQ